MTAFEQKPGGAGDGEKRIRCMYCGANNFPSSPTCWQCSRPLQSLRTPDPAAQPGAQTPLSGRLAPGQFAQGAGRASFGVSAESALAPKAAATLGMLFPYIGLPVGIVFLMLDDPRKTQLGWITIGWSVAGTVISTLLLIPMLAPVVAVFKGMTAPHGGQGGLPNIPGLPKIPSPDGDPENINILLLGYWLRNILSIIQAF